MAKTIRNAFSNMYGTGKNLNIGKNKTTKELLNSIPENMNINNEKNVNEINVNQRNVNLERKETLSVPNSKNPIINIPTANPMRVFYVIIILIVLGIIAIIFFYKDMMIHYFNTIFHSKKDETSEKLHSTAAKVDSTSAKVDNASAKVDSTAAKVDNTSAKVDHATAKVESTSAKLDDLEKKMDTLLNKPCGAVPTLNDKLNQISPYTKEQNVNQNSYCYIGYDNGQRECIEAYAGDICMSGEIFPTMDVCINPTLRK
jgi:methyl-accepting chemotaxis protein